MATWSEQAEEEVGAMLNCFPQGSNNPDALMISLGEALRDATDRSIISASRRFSAGRVAGQNMTFAPSVAEFCAEVRRLDAEAKFDARTALPKPALPSEHPESKARREARLQQAKADFDAMPAEERLALMEGYRNRFRLPQPEQH